MLAIQVLLIAVVLVVGGFLVRSTAGARHQAVRRLLLGFVVSSYRRSRQLEETMTQLARRLALDEAVTPEEHRRDSGTAP